MRSAIWFPLTLLAMLAALTFWIERTVQPPQPKRDGSSRHEIDYRMNNFTTTKSDSKGNPRHVLSAVELTHYPDDDSTYLVRPRFTQYAVRKPYTQIQGQRGQVSSDGENVYFMDNVQVERGAMPGRGKMRILTEYLHIQPDEEIARTDQPVSILQEPRTVIRATGMEYNKKLRTVKLFNRVRVHYEKPGADLPPLAAPPPLKPAAGKAPVAQARPVAAQKAPAQAAKKKSVKQKKAAAKTAKRQPKTGKTTTRIRRQYDATQR